MDRLPPPPGPKGNSRTGARIALRVVRNAADSIGLKPARIELPDGTVIAGVTAMAIEQDGYGVPVLKLSIIDFDVEIEGNANHK
jgi:hypothetical protein